MFETLVGHEKITTLFTRLVATNRVHHAYCFAGIPSLGKSTTARMLATALISIAPNTLHPDLLLVERGVHEKTGKKKERIDVDQIREVVSFCMQSPLLGTKKVVIIHDADTLTTSAANALLKTLEEPRPGRHLFLVADDPSMLPATILSRVHTIHFTPVPRSSLLAAAERSGYSTEMAGELADQAHGCPGLLFSWLANPEAFSASIAEEERFFALCGQSFSKKIQATEDLFEKDGDSVAVRDRQAQLITVWRRSLATCAQTVVTGSPSSKEWQTRAGFFPSLRAILDAEAALRRAEEHLRGHVNARLVFEDVFLHLP